ncbi:MAG TPA: bifunctional [glutamine synthetase] adenylyltransferase/[glutamine synthetase]-adenylyl-L-tyrosine phosphorylase, partial [Rhizobiales bacterium]|nr:bifunctional [glutamine synthetase] adenylyltransferase/[glutamine synthetase]-adenylyl-L-tyrosine phosphorylase [Hyphomicrobiales bacterium]
LEDDPATLARLRDIGFANPHAVSKTIKSWYAGRYNALRTATARQRLAEFMPDLLRALARPGNDPDAAFIAFDRFLSGLPSGVQLFSMLAANRHLLDLIARILSCAPRLAGELSRRPRIFDAVIEPGFFENLPGPDTLKELIERTMPPGTAYDIVLDQARIIHREQMFRIGARILSATINADEAASAYSDLAEALVARLLDNARDEMARRHGNIAGSALAVIAMGKLGGREMTATSDLDLIVVYDHEPGAAFSDGEKPLETNRYFARLTQRLVSGLTVPTSEGGLYEVDMRLRPSGNKGPVATSLSSFIEYQKSSAWTWEKMALTRARVIAADPGLEEKLNGAIRSALCQPCDAGKIRADALAMRKVMRTEKPPTGFWDLKNPDGGIIELEFIVQVLQVIHAASCPAILTGNMKKALARLRDHELLAAPKANDLLTALELYQSLSQVLKLGIKGEYRPETAPPGLTAMINRAAATPDIESTMALLKNTRQTVKSIFNEAVAGPARQA